MPRELGILGRIVMDSDIPANCRIDLCDHAVQVVRECMRDFDAGLDVGKDPTLTLLILGYKTEKLEQASEKQIQKWALLEEARRQAKEIAARIRKVQVERLHAEMCRTAPDLANKHREPKDIPVAVLLNIFKDDVLGIDFTHEQFVRAYLKDYVAIAYDRRVYYLTEQWQAWAKENGLHIAHPKTAGALENQPQQFIQDDDPRLKWLPQYVIGDTKTIIIRVGIWIRGGRLPLDFNEQDLLKLANKGASGVTQAWFTPFAIVKSVERQDTEFLPISGTWKKNFNIKSWRSLTLSVTPLNLVIQVNEEGRGGTIDWKGLGIRVDSQKYKLLEIIQALDSKTIPYVELAHYTGIPEERLRRIVSDVRKILKKHSGLKENPFPQSEKKTVTRAFEMFAPGGYKEALECDRELLLKQGISNAELMRGKARDPENPAEDNFDIRDIK